MESSMSSLLRFAAVAVSPSPGKINRVGDQKMSNLIQSGIGAIVFVVVAITSPFIALADCSTDIDKVENAIVNAQQQGIAETTAEQMRELLDNANAEREKGDEAKCQELINQAKYIGNVD